MLWMSISKSNFSVGLFRGLSPSCKSSVFSLGFLKLLVDDGLGIYAHLPFYEQCYGVYQLQGPRSRRSS